MSDSLEAALAHPTTCQSCGARIIFAITTNATAMPIDVEPNTAGNVTLTAGPISPHATVHPKGGQVDLFGQADTRYMPHHATCPDADSWSTTMTDPSPPTPLRRSVTIRLDAELVDWLEAEAERRLVGRRLLVDAGLRLLREAIVRAPDLVDLPPPPHPPRRPPGSAVRP